MSELATRILKVLQKLVDPGWSIMEGDLFYTMKETDPTIVQLYRFPHEVDNALKELQQNKHIEKHPIFPQWKMLKTK